MEEYNLLKKDFFGKEQKINIYKKIYEIREFEKQAKKSFDVDSIKCPIYLSIGQESISATISEFFKEDYIFTSITFAFTHKLPILFICEDNNLSILTKKAERRSWEITDALKGIGMPVADILDDPKLIAQKVNEFKNNLPAFINCRTCRHLWHVGTGQDEIPSIDRLKEFKNSLLNEGIDLNELTKIEEKIKLENEELWKKHLPKQ